MSVPENLNVYVSGLLFLLGAYLFALYLGLIVWTLRDIRARSRDVLAHIMAPLLVAVFTLPGLLIYYLLRPQTTLAEEYERSLAEEAILQDLDEQRICPGCRQSVESDFIVCPTCHHQLRLRCVDCGRLVSPRWDVCPYCGVFREQDDEALASDGIGGPAHVTALDSLDLDLGEVRSSSERRAAAEVPRSQRRF
jgi:RNA polymerase subunit RPABC4/transcription elongation factor Spt4